MVALYRSVLRGDMSRYPDPALQFGGQDLGQDINDAIARLVTMGSLVIESDGSIRHAQISTQRPDQECAWNLRDDFVSKSQSHNTSRDEIWIPTALRDLGMATLVKCMPPNSSLTLKEQISSESAKRFLMRFGGFPALVTDTMALAIGRDIIQTIIIAESRPADPVT